MYCYICQTLRERIVCIIILSRYHRLAFFIDKTMLAVYFYIRLSLGKASYVIIPGRYDLYSPFKLIYPHLSWIFTRARPSARNQALQYPERAGTSMTAFMSTIRQRFSEVLSRRCSNGVGPTGLSVLIPWLCTNYFAFSDRAQTATMLPFICTADKPSKNP